MKITVLGCGASAGVPSIGNHWGSCDPAEPKNRRRRPSILIQTKSTTILVDTGPDFRDQMNMFDIKGLDAVLYTHAHGDHVAGMDDLRPYRLRNKRLIDIYGMPETLKELRHRFDYMFTQKADIYPQIVRPHDIDLQKHDRLLKIGDIEVMPYEQDHGTCQSLGFRFDTFGYSTDMIDLDEASIEALRGIDIWLVDGAGYKMNDNQVHASLTKIYALNEKIGASKVYLTHMTPQMDYATLLRELPAGYEPAYDGLIIEI